MYIYTYIYISSLNALSQCLPFDCTSAFRPPRAAPADAVFTADCATAPSAPTNLRSIIFWGVNRLKDAATAHPADYFRKRARQKLPSLMTENGNACTTCAHLSPTPGFFAPFYYCQCLMVSAVQIQMMDCLNEGWSLYTMHICTFCA